MLQNSTSRVFSCLILLLHIVAPLTFKRLVDIKSLKGLNLLLLTVVGTMKMLLISKRLHLDENDYFAAELMMLPCNPNLPERYNGAEKQIVWEFTEDHI